MEVAFNTPHRTTICAPKTFMFVSVPQLTSVNDSYTLCNNNTSTAAGPSSCGVVREAWHRGWTGCVGCGLFEHSLFVGRDVCAAHQTASGCEDAIAGSLWMAPTTLGTGRGCSHDAGACFEQILTMFCHAYALSRVHNPTFTSLLVFMSVTELKRCTCIYRQSWCER